MVQMVSLKKSKADQEAEKESLGSAGEVMSDYDHGVSVHLSHHHLKKLGVGGGLKSGHKVELHGKGVVEHTSSTSSGKDGETHSATIRLHRAHLEHEIPRGGDEEKRDVRGDLEKAYAGVEDKSLPDKKSRGAAK
jgi:hypothetical protein